MNPSTILVTGGAGFIGSHVADELLKRGHKVVVLDDLSGGFRENVPASAVFVEGSITDTALVEKLFDEHHFDYVYHLAAYAAEGLSHFIRHFNYDNNLIGSMNLINAAINHDIKCFVFTSSIAVYGSHQAPFDESTVPEPEDPYGVAKYAVELDLAAAQRMFGMPHIIFRPHNVYGERQNVGDKYRNVIGIFMNKIMQGVPMPIFGDGEQQRAFSHIEDVAPIIARAIEVPEAYNQVYNVGADTPYTVNHLAKVVAVAMGAEPKIEYLPERQEVKVAFSKHAKAQAAFGSGPDITLEDGITRMAAWAQKVGAKESKKFGHIEIERNLPPSWQQ